MSYHLDAIAEARENRHRSEAEFRAALVRARAAGHSLRELGRAAGLTHNGVKHLLLREEARKP